MTNDEFHDALYRERCRREAVESDNRSLRDALTSLDSRLRECFHLPISAEEAYDSFYQDVVAEALKMPNA